MAVMTQDDLLDAFKEMTLLELSEFVKKFEETFEVTAAAPVAVAATGGPAAPAEVEDEKDEFDVVLDEIGDKKIQVIKVVRELTSLGLKEAKDLVESAGDKKIQVIKEVRALTSLGLKEAKDLVDAAPKAVLEGVTKEAAEKAKAQLEAAGATVTLK